MLSHNDILSGQADQDIRMASNVCCCHDSLKGPQFACEICQLPLDSLNLFQRQNQEKHEDFASEAPPQPDKTDYSATRADLSPTEPSIAFKFPVPNASDETKSATLSTKVNCKSINLFLVGVKGAGKSVLAQKLCQGLEEEKTGDEQSLFRKFTVTEDWQVFDWRQALQQCLIELHQRLDKRAVEYSEEEEENGNSSKSLDFVKKRQDDSPTPPVFDKYQIWDFKGNSFCQKILQFFICPNSIFLVCFDIRKHTRNCMENLSQLRSWLSSIAFHNECRPPIFLIATNVESEVQLTEASKFIAKEIYEDFDSYLVPNGDCILFTLEETSGSESVISLKEAIESQIKKVSRDNVRLFTLFYESLLQHVVEESQTFCIKMEKLEREFEKLHGHTNPEDFSDLMKELRRSGVIRLPESMSATENELNQLAGKIILNTMPLLKALEKLWKFAKSDSFPSTEEAKHKTRLRKNSIISHQGLKQVFDRLDQAEQLIEAMVLSGILIELKSDVANKNNNIPINPDYFFPYILETTDSCERWVHYLSGKRSDTFLIDAGERLSEDFYWQVIGNVLKLNHQECYHFSKHDCIFYIDDKYFRLIYNQTSCNICCRVSGSNHSIFLNGIKWILAGMKKPFWFLVPCCEFPLKNKAISADFTDDDGQVKKGTFSELDTLLEGPCCPCDYCQESLRPWLWEQLQPMVSQGNSNVETEIADLITKDPARLSDVASENSYQWKELARKLDWPKNTNVDNAIIAMIDSDNVKYTSPYEKAYQMLLNWGQRSTGATFQKLASKIHELSGKKDCKTSKLDKGIKKE